MHVIYWISTVFIKQDSFQCFSLYLLFLELFDGRWSFIVHWRLIYKNHIKILGVILWYGITRVTSYDFQVTSYNLRVESLKARAEIQKCEFKSTSSNSQVTSSTLRVTSSNPRVTTLNPQVTSSNPRVASSNPRVQESFNQRKLKETA